MSVDMIKNTTTLSGAKEPIACEINVSDTLRLSDNMSSIKKILFTKETVLIKSSEIYLGTYTIKGEVCVHVLYLGENEESDYISSPIPFEYTGECGAQNDAVLYINSEIASCEILPIKQRRLDVNINVSVSGFCFEQISLDTLEGIGGVDNLCFLKEKREASLLRSLSSTQDFRFEFDTAQSSAGKIIYACGTFANVATSASGAGILVNGLLKEEVLYTTENEDGTLNYHSYCDTFPINHFIETEFTTQYDSYEVASTLSCCGAQFIYGEKGVSIEIEATICCTAILTKKIAFSCISDLYSPDVKLIPTIVEKPCLFADKTISQTLMLTENVRLITTGSFFKVACTKETLTSAFHISERKLTIYGDVLATAVIIKDERGSMEAVDAKLHFEWECDCDFREDDFFFAARLQSCTYEIKGDTLVINAELAVGGTVLRTVSQKQIDDVSLEEYPQLEDNFVSIKVHYYQPGETLWELAKQNRTTVEQLLSANGMEKEEHIKAYQPLMIKSF